MNDKETISEVVTALRRIIHAIDLRSRYLASKFDITVPQLTVMSELAGRAGISICDLKNAVHLSQATITGIIDRLEKKNFVKRTKSSTDKRRTEIWLTGQGQKVLDSAPPLLQEDFTKQFGKLADWEKMQILSSLQRVVSMMETKSLEVEGMFDDGQLSA